MVGVDFCLLLGCAGRWAGAGLFAFVKRSRGLVGRPGRPPTCSWPPLAPAAATPRSGARVGGGADRGRDAGPEGVAWHSKSKELRLAQIGSGAARGLRRATSAGIFSPNGWPGGLPSAPDAARPKCPQLSRCPTPAAGRGGQAAARCHARPSASSAATAPAATPVPARRGAHTFPSLPPARPKFPALGRRAAASGATARGTPGPGRLRRLAF